MTGREKPLPRLLTPAELAKTLRLSVRTLENWRLRGWGPPYIRFGTSSHHKVVYDWHAVEEWLEQFRQPS